MYFLQLYNFQLLFDFYSMFYKRMTVTSYSQQDATFLEFIYIYRRCTSFSRFLHPSSGTHNRTYSFRYCQPMLLLAATVEQLAAVLVDNT